MKQLFLLAAIFSFALCSNAYPQGCGNLNIGFQSDIPSSCMEMTMTMMQDTKDRPFLYVAQKEGGLKIYNITNLASPICVDSVPIELLDSLHVMNLTQDGDYLYLALGNSFGTGQNPGMAIINISDPAHATVSAVYKYPGTGGGGGIVKVEGDYAYLGAMLHGLVILDISDKQKIRYVSEFLPDRNFPTANPDTLKYNARGMAVRNSIIYLCFDAGGVRIISAADKTHPVEIGRYSNPEMNGRPRAYNNIVLNDSIAYIAVDYCGMEILNIADPSDIKPLSWWNPWNCTSNPLAWFSSLGHANEIDLDRQCKRIFLATGKSDMYIVDVSNPFSPDSCANFGGIDNNIGTWGISTYKDRIYLSYVCTAGIPFASNWTGVKILSYTPCQEDVAAEETSSNAIEIFPVPSGRIINIDLHHAFTGASVTLSVVDVLGKDMVASRSLKQERTTLDLSNIPSGTYYVRLSSKAKVVTKKIIRK